MAIYADHAATTPCLPEVANAVAEACIECYGNPSSNHYKLGRDARFLIDETRQSLANLVGIERVNEIVFTSGATESCNMAILGVAQRRMHTRTRIIAMETEHPAILQPLSHISSAGFDVQVVNCQSNGQMDLDHLSHLCNQETALVCAMLVNNETGVIQDLHGISSIAHQSGALVICDATQALGKISIRNIPHNADFLAFSAHKCYGPKGVGALWIRRHLNISPLFYGGGQEQERRSGTENVPGIAGWNAALAHINENEFEYSKKIGGLQIRLESAIKNGLPDVIFNGQKSLRAPGFTSLTLPGLPRGWLTQLNGICASSGSSCSSGQTKPSRVLQAYGHNKKDASNSLRITLGINNNEAEIDEIAKCVIDGATRLQERDFM